MAAEMPVKVEPVEGAVAVDFPWADARAAVGALNSAATTLETQLESRASMGPTLADWTGAFRTEFDTALTPHHRRGVGADEFAGDVAHGLLEANQRLTDRPIGVDQRDTLVLTVDDATLLTKGEVIAGDRTAAGQRMDEVIDTLEHR